MYDVVTCCQSVLVIWLLISEVGNVGVFQVSLVFILWCAISPNVQCERVWERGGGRENGAGGIDRWVSVHDAMYCTVKMYPARSQD